MSGAPTADSPAFPEGSHVQFQPSPTPYAQPQQFHSQPNRPSSQSQSQALNQRAGPSPLHPSHNGMAAQLPNPNLIRGSIQQPQQQQVQPVGSFQRPGLGHPPGTHIHPQHPTAMSQAPPPSYPKPLHANPMQHHMPIASAPPNSMSRPSQQQMAQHLMNPQAHMRAQRLLQQQQMQQQQRMEEAIMITDPLDCFTNRNLAIRRYATNHHNMNSILGNHWDVNQLLRGAHGNSFSKRKVEDSSPPEELANQRKQKLKQQSVEIERDIDKSNQQYNARLTRLFSQ